MALQNTRISKTATDTVVVAAADTKGRKNKLHSIHLNFVGEWTIEVKDGSTSLMGAQTYKDGGVCALTPELCATLQSSADTALNITLTLVSGSGTCAGYAAYLVAA